MLTSKNPHHQRTAIQFPHSNVKAWFAIRERKGRLTLRQRTERVVRSVGTQIVHLDHDRVRAGVVRRQLPALAAGPARAGAWVAAVGRLRYGGVVAGAAVPGAGRLAGDVAGAVLGEGGGLVAGGGGGAGVGGAGAGAGAGTAAGTGVGAGSGPGVETSVRAVVDLRGVFPLILVAVGAISPRIGQDGEGRYQDICELHREGGARN